MVPDEVKERLENNMEAPDSKEKVAVIEVENEYQTCVSNYEDFMFELDPSSAEHAGEERTTESSSSFDDVSGVDNGGLWSDDEVVSDFREDSFNGHGEMFSMRKKKVTNDWRKQIQPLMWRCKWVELQIKKLSMYERTYAKELTKYNQEESSQVERPTTDHSSRKVPSSDGRQTHQVLKRKKRKKIEDIVDVATFMSQHNLFSYYENKKAPADGIRFHDERKNLENKKAPADGICFQDDRRNLEKANCNDEFGMDDISLWLESCETLESVEVVLRKIEMLKGQVSNLKTRLDKVKSVSAVKFSYAANSSLLVPCNALTSSGPVSAAPPNNGDRVAVGSSYIASQLISQYHMHDVVPPESAVSRGVAHLSDITDRRKRPELGDPCHHIEDETLIHNHKTRDEMNEVEMQPLAAVRVDQGNPIRLDSNVLTDDQPPKRTMSSSELSTPMVRRSQRRRKRRRF